MLVPQVHVYACSSVYTMHRRPDLYPQPETFAPERFSAANEHRLPRHAYLPFGAGAHVCLGGHFALMELHLVLATWLQRHDIALVPGQTIVPAPAFVLQPARHHGRHAPPSPVLITAFGAGL